MPAVAKYKLYSATRVHNQKFNEKKYSKLRERIEYMKPSVDNCIPEGFELMHRLRRPIAITEKNVYVKKRNDLISHRLDEIKHTKSNIGKNEYYIPASKRRNPYREQRITNVLKIYRENLLLCHRLKEIMEMPGENADHPGVCACGMTQLVGGVVITKSRAHATVSLPGALNLAGGHPDAHHAPATAGGEHKQQPEVQPVQENPVVEETAAAKQQQAETHHKKHTPPVNDEKEKVCPHCGVLVSAIEHLGEKEKRRLKQTFSIYTNGVKAELDHYQVVKEEEKKHHLAFLNKQKQKKRQSKFGQIQEEEEEESGATGTETATEINSEETKQIRIESHHVTPIESAFSLLSIGKSRK